MSERLSTRSAGGPSDGLMTRIAWRTALAGAKRIRSGHLTVVLPDGTWLIADAAEEVLRVHDPLGRFEIVDAAYVPGVFGLTVIACGDGGGLPCLGVE